MEYPPARVLRARSRSVTRLIDPVRHYLKEVQKQPALSRAQEAELVRRMRAKRRVLDAHKARTEFVAASLALVIAVAKTHLNRGLSFLELIHEGNMGLLEATKHFEPKRDGRFRAYARPHIRRAIAAAIAKT